MVTCDQEKKVASSQNVLLGFFLKKEENCFEGMLN